MKITNKDSENSKHLISQISMLISAISMGFVGIFVDLLSHFPIYTIVFLRGLFGTLFLTIFMFITKSFSRDFLSSIFKRHWKALILVGITNPLVIYFYFVNISISSYAISAFLLYTNGIFLLIILYITKEDRDIKRINVISFILAIIGIIVIMRIWTGNLLVSSIIAGILSSIFLALLNFSKKVIYNKPVKFSNMQEVNEANIDHFLAWWATLTLTLFFFPFGISDLSNLNFIDLGVSILLGLIPTALAFTLFNIGVKRDKGGNIIILAYFEPVIATINTAIFRGEFSIYTIIGGLFILLANILILKYSNGKRRSARL
ncbi:MAG: EamA family transporter [Candidatus Lokiarchaeota archaeon]|nr:EamA family transporter [Candidatus Lokiarchaeota archaeon]MBD3198376.1 EamA family transporter [Candidatus Lokiarchaeota archaeon]